MAGICSSLVTRPTLTPIGLATRRIQKLRCCSDDGDEGGKQRRNYSTTPKLLSLAVTGLTEILRLLSPGQNATRLDEVNDMQINKEVPVSSIEDVLMFLELDYNSSYFVTGNFTPAIYSEDCLFEDPTIKFRGTQLYSRNLKLLVPFFENPSIVLKKIEKGNNSGIHFVLATWKLRTYLRLPWRPFISIDGNTVYELDDQFKIIRHTESWDISALQAVRQIFRPS